MKSKYKTNYYLVRSTISSFIFHICVYCAMGENNGVLNEHRRYKTKFTPPLLDDFGETLEQVDWTYEFVPEVLWIDLLFEECGPQRAIEITEECAKSAQSLFGGKDYVYSCDYDGLSDDEFQRFREELGEKVLSDLSNALAPLAYHYPTFPQARLVGGVGDFDPDCIGLIQKAVNDLSSRHSRPATIVQATYIYVLISTEKMSIPEDTPFEDLNEIMNYPETDRSRLVGSSVRAATKANRAAREDNGQSEWMKRFWSQGFEITECVFPGQLEDSGPDEPNEEGEEIPDDEFYEGLVEIGREYEESLLTSLVEVWWDADHDPEFSGQNAVLDALLMRQVSLATKIATTPALWYTDLSAIILRCMAETQITLEWFNKVGEIEDYEKFIEYGLGQQKLNLEHQFKMLSGYEGDVGNVEVSMEEAKRMLEEQRYTFLLPVDVGSWNKNTRKMAEEAGCKQGLYDLRFSYHSGTTHGMWHALEQQNLVKCQNPLHKYHRIPNFNGPWLIPFAIVEAGNMMNRSLGSWIEARNVDISDIEIYDLAGTVKSVLREHRGLDI